MPIKRWAELFHSFFPGYKFVEFWLCLGVVEVFELGQFTFVESNSSIEKKMSS